MRKRISLLALLAALVVAVPSAIAGQNIFWVSDGSVRGNWYSTPGYASRVFTDACTLDLSSEGYVQLKYEHPTLGVVWNSYPQYVGSGYKCIQGPSSSYVKVFCRFGDPNNVTRWMRCSWWN